MQLQFTMLEQIFMKDWLVVAVCFKLKYVIIPRVHFPVRVLFSIDRFL